MKAGRTSHDVNTHVRVTKIVSSDSEDQSLVGVTGRITHPFAGLMVGNPDKYIAGIWIDDEHKEQHGEHVNLCRGDEYEVIQ